MLSSAPVETLDGECVNASRRNRSIRLAITSSLLSKGGTILLQLVSIPIALRVLGREEFGIYSTVNLSLSLIALLEVGVGPALTHGLAQARAAGDKIRQRELASTAFCLIAGIALITGIALATLLLTVPLVSVYGATFTAHEDMLRHALWVALGLSLVVFVLNSTDRIREGHLEVASNNFWGAAGNVMAAAVVAGGILLVPEVWFLICAIQGAAVVAKLCNTLTLWKKHPLMRPSLGYCRKSVAKLLFSDGVAFSVCCVVGMLVEFNLCGLMVGRLLGPSGVALYGIFINMTIMQLGFVVMLSTPTWPAVAEALARGDLAWARGAGKKLYRYGVAFALCSAAGLLLLGPWILPLWLGKEFSNLGRPLLASYGLYFFAYVWRHLNHTLMIGTGQVARLAKVQVIETAIVAGVAWFALKWGGVEALFATMAVICFLTTGLLLPRFVARVLGKAQASS